MGHRHPAAASSPSPSPTEDLAAHSLAGTITSLGGGAGIKKTETEKARAASLISRRSGAERQAAPPPFFWPPVQVLKEDLKAMGRAGPPPIAAHDSRR